MALELMLWKQTSKVGLGNVNKKIVSRINKIYDNNERNVIKLKQNEWNESGCVNNPHVYWACHNLKIFTVPKVKHRRSIGPFNESEKDWIIKTHKPPLRLFKDMHISFAELIWKTKRLSKIRNKFNRLQGNFVWFQKMFLIIW